MWYDEHSVLDRAVDLPYQQWALVKIDIGISNLACSPGPIMPVLYSILC
jgi:hypothetical protein